MVKVTEINANQTDISGDNGVLKRILLEATSSKRPLIGCKVSIHYIGKLSDGTKFDSTYDRKQPFEFKLGKHSDAVIKGFDKAVESMKLGEKAEFTVFPEYAYGDEGKPPKIPPNSTLTFEIELLFIGPEDLSPNNTDSILREVVKKPKMLETAFDGVSVTVNLIGKHGKRIFDERDLTFNLGLASPDDVIDGVQIALMQFGKGETSILTIKPEFAFGEKGSEKFGIPPNATVEYTVTMNDFEVMPRIWDLKDDDSMAQAQVVKDRATQFFKKGDYNIAIKLFMKTKGYLKGCTASEGEYKTEEAKKMVAVVYSNIALCNLKLKRFSEAKEACDTVLEHDPNNVKALYRRGTSLFEMGEAAEALEDFLKVQELEPENKAAQNQITLSRIEAKRQKANYKGLCSSMFAKKNTN